MPRKARQPAVGKASLGSVKRSKKKILGFWKKVPKILFGDDVRKSVRRPKIIQRKSKVKPTARKKKSAIFIKPEENPIISPRAENEWEAWQTFNPGVILLDDPEKLRNGASKVHFLYRAIGSDGISRFGYAVSSDGFTIDERLSYPVFEHRLTKGAFNYYSFASGGSFGGAEDPRLVRVEDEDKIYMTYTACDGGLRVGLTSIMVDDFLKRKWRWRAPALISPPGEVHKNWMLFPEKINGQYAILTSINPKIFITYRDTLDFKEGEYITSTYNGVCRRNCWDTCVRGAGAPPIKTNYGWIVFYHAIDERDLGKYKVGAMLLGIADPTVVLSRSQNPILEPEEVYENNGFKGGVVYVSGAVIKDGKLLLYYGAADSYVGVAYADFEKFLEELRKGIKPKLERMTLRKAHT